MFNIFPLAYYHTQFIDKFVTNPPQLIPNKNPFWDCEEKKNVFFDQRMKRHKLTYLGPGSPRQVVGRAAL